MAIMIAETEGDALLAGYDHRHWLSMGLAPADVAPAWRENALGFIAEARRGRAFAGFVARDADGPVGGDVWGVYVEPASRGRGIGAALVRACLAHLSARGCGRVLLHAGGRSRPLYERLGVAPTDELALALDAGT